LRRATREQISACLKFQAKHALGLDPGQRSVSVKKTHQINNLEPCFDSIEAEKALADTIAVDLRVARRRSVQRYRE
jgi:hypothetical protein